jgi:glycosyltransferase involved in cell wall biosynthesis
MSATPLISVLMSTYNVGPYVEEAVESILRQTVGDFELLVVDDASGDGTHESLTRLAGRDRRIGVWRNDSNRGVAASINGLVGEARGALVARMDGDDIAVPSRFERQLHAMEENIDVLGGWMSVFGDGRERVQRYPSEHHGIRAGLMFCPMFSQPTVMLRRDLLRRVPYREESGILEDYDLWARLSLAGARMANLPEVLLRHRRHPSQTSSRLHAEQWRIAAGVSLDYLQALGIAASEEERRIHVDVRSPRPPQSIEEVVLTENWLSRLAGQFEDADAKRVISSMWYRYCLKAAPLGIATYRRFQHSGLLAHLRPKPWQHAALLSLGLLRLQQNSKAYRALAALSPAACKGRGRSQ